MTRQATKLEVEKVKDEKKKIIHQEHMDIDLFGVDMMGLMVLQQFTN